MAVEELTGIILAGGQSSRMGRDKALLPIEGKPLLQTIAERMLQLGMRRIVIASGTPEREATYASLLPKLPAEVAYAADRFPDCGPLAGLHAALSLLPGGAYGFVMACDMPYISETLLERMLQAAVAAGGRLTTEGSTRIITGPQVIRVENQPFHALYHASAAAELAQRLARKELRMMSLLGALRSVQVPIYEAEEAAFLNLNAPELYEQYIRSLQH
ncbi:molybdenum cofactor guanylyltransferase [Paenibacillus sp. R14(2021)]|uniref:molybdenum cofactor guanylyltransferase n=1 Tax=Paenibacillus sp. R14(2021) TaxID=2859228 RepID=UPI001C6119F6|nr:molybdenum cofactor guanylyltransferase [Paenibacillus sp. R14(2021)]